MMWLTMLGARRDSDGGCSEMYKDWPGAEKGVRNF